MRLSLAYAYASAVAGILGGSASRADAAAPQPQLVFKGRTYYSYGYKDGTTEGVPDGYGEPA